MGINLLLKDETKDSKPRSVPNQGSIESTVNFFMKPFDYLYNEEYLSKEERAWMHKIDELIHSGRASSVEKAAEIAELEIEEKTPPSRKDVKTGVA